MTHHTEHQHEPEPITHETTLAFAKASAGKDEIAELKAEILGSLKEKENKNVLPWGSWLVTTVLVALTLLATVQTVQSAVLLDKIKNGKVNLGGSAPAVLDSAPDMVGGC